MKLWLTGCLSGFGLGRRFFRRAGSPALRQAGMLAATDATNFIFPGHMHVAGKDVINAECGIRTAEFRAVRV